MDKVLEALVWCMIVLISFQRVTAQPADTGIDELLKHTYEDDQSIWLLKRVEKLDDLKKKVKVPAYNVLLASLLCLEMSLNPTIHG